MAEGAAPPPVAQTPLISQEALSEAAKRTPKLEDPTTWLYFPENMLSQITKQVDEMAKLISKMKDAAAAASSWWQHPEWEKQDLQSLQGDAQQQQAQKAEQQKAPQQQPAAHQATEKQAPPPRPAQQAPSPHAAQQAPTPPSRSTSATSATPPSNAMSRPSVPTSKPESSTDANAGRSIKPPASIVTTGSAPPPKNPAQALGRIAAKASGLFPEAHTGTKPFTWGRGD